MPPFRYKSEPCNDLQDVQAYEENFKLFYVCAKRLVLNPYDESRSDVSAIQATVVGFQTF